MSLLANWVNSALASAIGWTLLHSLWQGAIVAAALAALLAPLRAPRARYAAACVALLLMLAGFGFTLVRELPSGRGLGAAGPRAFAAWNIPADLGDGGPAHLSLAALVPWLAPLWSAGVWMFALWQLGGWITVCRLRRRGVCSAPERWQKELVRLSARLRLARPIQILESCLAHTPFVLGHFRPVILIPVGLLTGLPAAQIEAILLHELAHIRRHDYLVNVLQKAAECLLFYHPAVWWVSRVIREERESCCDDVSVAAIGSAKEYAQALTALEQQRCSGREPAVAAGGGSLVKRIRRLMCPQGPSTPWTLALAGLILASTVGVALAAWSPKPSELSLPPSQQQASTAEPSLLNLPGPSLTVMEQMGTASKRDRLTRTDGTAIGQAMGAPESMGEFARLGLYANMLKPTRYDRWVSEEVPYIITVQEREAFQKLKTDEERDMFIEQFWERRNPNPGSNENAFKEEYYRRIAYANEHYASGRPGWKNDRGHLYIMYGPPDEIDSHPAGAPYPHEEWIYRFIEGLGNNVKFTFEDRKGNGDYPLVGHFPSVPPPKPAR